MTELLTFVFIGLGVGAIYALAAHGIVLVYRGSGVLNFAHGAIALVAASAFASLRNGMATPLAAILATLLAMALGAAIERLVIRPLRGSSPVARLIATLGVLTVLSQGVLLRYGDTPRFTPAVLPAARWTLPGGVPVSSDRIYLLCAAVTVTAVLWVVYARTPFGRATVAAAENEVVASSVGWSPALIASVNWIVGAGLAGLTGILIAPVTSISPGAMTTLVLPALAAALVGGFVSFPVTLIGATGIGVAESVLTRYVSTPGWSSAAPLLVIIVVLVFRGRGLPLRSQVLDRLPRAGSGELRLSAVAGLVLLLGGLVVFSSGFADAVTSSTAVALIVLSLVVVTGYAGQLSLAQYGLAGIGALASSRLADAWDVPFLLAAVGGVAAAVPVAVLVGLPALRTRGVNLAIATLGLAIAIEKLILSNPRYTGGPVRGTIVPAPSVFGLSLDPISSPKRYAAFGVLVLAVGGLVVSNVRRGVAGRRMLAVRSNERAASALGINVMGTKLYAFATAGALAGAGGVLLAFRYEHVLFSQFRALNSVDVVLYGVVGGIGSVVGALVGALLAPSGILTQVLGRFTDPSRWVTFAAGALVIVTVVRRPDGLVDLVASVRSRVRPRRTAPCAEPLSDPPRRRVRPMRLEVVGVTVRFGGVTAVDEVDLVVEPGTVVGLIGPNGAGKTTLVDAMTGFVSAGAGQIRLDGENISGWPAHRRARAGLGRSFQSLELFEDVTVLDNLRMASDEGRGRVLVTDLVRPRRTPLSPAAAAAVEEFGLQDDLLRLPSELAYGRRRLVALARAMAMEPSVLLLDEPAAGIDNKEAAELATLIRRLADDWGVAVLLIEHDVELVMQVCDEVVALEFGRVIASGEPAAIRSDEAVVAAYLGDGDPAEAGPAAGARS